MLHGWPRRLTQDVTTLEIQPTIEDVFHADTRSVEDYLKQVEEATILAAIQVCIMRRRVVVVVVVQSLHTR